MNIAEVDRELRRQRTGHELGERQSLLVIGLRDPLALLHQVAVHIADERDRAAEADGAELRHVLDKLPERVRQRYACGFHVCTSCFPSLHHVYSASYMTMPCFSISWSSEKLRDRPREIAARPGACGASSSRAVSAPRTMMASSLRAGSLKR